MRPACDLRILAQRFDATGQDLRLSWKGTPHQVRLNLIGGFQAENVALAAGLVIGAGEAPGDVLRVLPGLTGVRGRMQLAATRKNGASVFVDYAHTPDAIATALKALRPHVMGRLIVVFGAGGDRDRGKRPLMGAGRRRPCRCPLCHRRQPPLRRPRLHPRRDHGRLPRGAARSATGPRRSCAASTPCCPATPC